jgi:hypothetical protein
MAKSNFGKALGRELGKNTGKLISNKLFGNGHATPYRVTGRAQAAQIRADGVKAQAEALKVQANAQLEIEEIRLKQENTLREIATIGEIANVEFSENPKEISSQLNQIISLLSAQKSREVLKAGIEKIDFGILTLTKYDLVQANYFETKLKKLKFRYNFPYYSLIGGVVLLGLGALFMNLQKSGGLFNIGIGLLLVGMYASLFTLIKLFKKD